MGPHGDTISADKQRLSHAVQLGLNVDPGLSMERRAWPEPRYDAAATLCCDQRVVALHGVCICVYGQMLGITHTHSHTHTH